MEVENRPVVISDLAIESLENIYAYGIAFSRSSATVFIEELYVQINLLSSDIFIIQSVASFRLKRASTETCNTAGI